ncbi:MAG: sigma-54-dependent Fis family transcriptional regulator [Candidatus Cloacimonetes bacterium]|jgi:DNA-binding NtrC family response regulator|nr:sigma-54-dependent Fis family transcriptional regulator [Candidatus Cloacimonadota bacterium]
MATILCVDDEATSLLVLQSILDAAGHDTTGVSSVDAALDVLSRGEFDLIISDYRMPGATGLELLARLRELGIETPLIMATGYATIEHAVASIKSGAIDYITKPFREEQLRLVVDQALELVSLRRENETLRDQVSQIRTARRVVGENAGMARLMETVRMIAPSRASVLLQGESGTGKELIARAIHDLSNRASAPFISVNCAALPETLVESTLFGHEKGAFTGAVRQVKGAFERAHNGTLLLDEVSEMRLDLQAKLLRVIQEQEFERVGGTTSVRVNVRIIATTNRNLADEVREGRFREDLFFRLSVVPLRLPPLRERLEDVPALAMHFLQRTAQELGKQVTGITPRAIELLQSRRWPGNVRELAHAIERAVILATGPVLDEDLFCLEDHPVLSGFDLPLQEQPAADTRTRASDSDGVIELDTLDLAEAERVLIERALERTGDNRTQAAELLGISVRTLRNKLNRPVGV